MANPFTRVRVFFGETVDELKKASWPNGQELRESTVVVFIAIALVGAYIALADFASTGVVIYLSNLVTGGRFG